MYYDKLLSIILGLILFFLLPQVAHAASSQIISPPTDIVKASEYSAQVSFSATPSTEYHLKIRVGQTSSTLTKGKTWNDSISTWATNSGASGSWDKHPKVTTDTFGNWSGSLKFKTDSAEMGANVLGLRVHPVTAGSDIDSPLYNINVGESIASPTSSTEEEPTPSSPVTISSHPSSVEAGASFVVVGNTTLEPNKTFAAKVLMGTSPESKDMKTGSTEGKDGAWLAWNSAWDKFNELSTDASGKAQFNLNAKTSSDASGVYYMILRVRDLGEEENLDSSAVSFNVSLAPTASDPEPESTTVSEMPSEVLGEVTSTKKEQPTSLVKTESKSSPASGKVEAKIGTKTDKKEPNKTTAALFDQIGIKPVGEVLGSESEDSKKSVPPLKVQGLSTEVILVSGIGALIVLSGVGLLFKEQILRRLGK